MLGAFMCEFFDKVVLCAKKFWYCGLIAMAAYVLMPLPGTLGKYSVLGSMLAGFTWIGFSYAFPRLQIKWDISYGIYIYHMIIINVLIALGFIGKWTFFGYAFLATILLAIGSYVTIGFVSRKRKEQLQ